MAIHNSTHSLIHEALTEYLAIAEHCITTGKPTGGCYGFPTALLCFTIVDAIGSFYRGNTSFTINIDKKTRTIDGDGFKHYFILNSDYYGQSLSEKDIKRLYEYYRCLLVHNAALAPNCILDIGKETDPPFARHTSQHIDYVNLRPFLDLSHIAVAKFLKVSPTLVPVSKQGKGIENKR
ncbi:MAG: hypothetical protein ABSG71_15110 [Thermodesulfobacteriota bacterium]|jgi:hypothetical protein